jgi:pyridoxal phosphate enzyme (YggS family)
MSDQRRDTIAANLVAVRARVEAAAASSDGRPGSGVTLVVVTKTWPASDLRILSDLGVRDFGENRHQEAAEKAANLADLDVRWHFIGQVQSNKASRIAGYAAAVHSVDSVRVARRLDAGAQQGSRIVDCFIQVSLDPAGASSGRGGVALETVPEIADVIAGCRLLRLAGVMGVAPLGEEASAAYDRLVAVSRQLELEHPLARGISAGMSGDFEAAVRAGATHVRVGSAVLGRRPSLG